MARCSNTLMSGIFQEYLPSLFNAWYSSSIHVLRIYTSFEILPTYPEQVAGTVDLIWVYI